jgi:hypothetical protein
MFKHARKLVLMPLVVLSASAFACNASYTVHLQTFGEGVLVELRAGAPGASRVARSAQSTGGTVSFSDLCPGGYFLAIGNEESVSVGPVRFFENDHTYTSRIALQKGSGNLTRRSRKSL